MTNTDPIKALVDLEPELQRKLRTDHNICLFSDELKVILAAIEALRPLADGTLKGGCKMAWKQGFCYGDPEYYPPPASPAPVDGERVRAAKIEAFDEALSIAEGSYSYGEQQNEIIAGIRAALAAINGEQT